MRLVTKRAYLLPYSRPAANTPADTFPEVTDPPAVEPTECMACALSAGHLPLPGGLIHRKSHWLVEHTVGPLGLGTLIVKPERHVTHVADLAPDEALELGPLLARSAAVVTELCEPDQVYVCLWSHAGFEPGHIHFVVQPVNSDDARAAGGTGPAYQAALFASGAIPAPDDVERWCDRARAAFGRDRPE